MIDRSICRRHGEALSFALGEFGTGQHPGPTAANLPFFAERYARECLSRALASPLVAKTAHHGLQAALKALQPAQPASDDYGRPLVRRKARPLTASKG